MNTCYNTKMSDFIPWFLEESPRPDNWEDLYFEYVSLRENKSSLYVLGVLKEITYLKVKHKLVEECCKILNVCFQHVLTEPAKELKATLKAYGFRFAYDLADEAAFSRDIRATLSQNKKTIQAWERKEKELDQYQAKHTGQAWTRKDFYVWAVTLSEHTKNRVDLDVITVAEWAIMLNRYEKYCEVANAQTYGKRYGRSK